MGGNEIDSNISERKSHRPKDISERELVRDNDINIMTAVPIISTLGGSAHPSAVMGAARVPSCHPHQEKH